MKHKMKRFFQNAMTVVFLLITEITFAQTVTTHTKTVKHTTDNGMFLPLWAWVAGGVVALIIIIALVSRSNSKVVITK